jgi:hypothetical protein
MTPLLPRQLRSLSPAECPYCEPDAAPGDQLCWYHEQQQAAEDRERRAEWRDDR